MKRLESKHLLFLPYILIAGVALLRLELSHPQNLVPVFTCLIFFGAMRPAREFALPLLTCVGVDLFLTTHQYGFPLTFGSTVTWAWYLVAMLLGAGMLRGSISLHRLAGSSLLSAISFFLVSNFTVWAEWNMYPKTLGGLGACYVAALPFFRNSVISELVFSVLLFVLCNFAVTSLAMKTAPEARS